MSFLFSLPIYVVHVLVQAVYVIFSDDHVMKLPYFIAIAGIVCALFAISIPHLSALRIWLGFSTFFSLVYIVAAFALSLRDGKNVVNFTATKCVN